jgi:MFS family permease
MHSVLRPIADLLRSSAPVRRFFLAHAQSALGAGLGYVALMLLALERFDSPWAVAGIVLADLLPVMLFGAALGALADRLPRRACAVGADLLRAGALVGIVFVDGIVPTLALAAVAGLGHGLFFPAVLAGLPDLAGERHAAAATSLFSGISQLGKTLGPLLGVALFAAGGVELALLVDGVSYALSALLLIGVHLGGGAPAAGDDSTAGEPGDGPRPLAIRGFPILVATATGAMLFAGISNVAEPSFITDDLGKASSAFALVIAIYGLGFGAGTLTGTRGGARHRLWSAYFLGLLATGAGILAVGLAPGFLLVLPAFALFGLGNGVVVVQERLLVQDLVPERVIGRAFGTIEMAASWSLAVAFTLGALAVDVVGAREALVIAGAGTLLVWAIGATARASRAPVPEAAPL